MCLLEDIGEGWRHIEHKAFFEREQKIFDSRGMGIYSDIPNVEFLKEICMKLKKKRERETFKGFPRGSVVKNLLASA